MKIGIVGQGYVGMAVNTIFKCHYEVDTYDIDSSKRTCDSLSELANKVKIIFVCVPTPMNNDGSCCLNIVNEVIDDINNISKIDGVQRVIILKSTVVPGTTIELNKKYRYVSIVFNPEFLTEANFIEDFKNQDRIIIGGQQPDLELVKNLYLKVFPKSSIVETDSKYAEMVKYFINTFLALKVSFANEMKMICDKLNINYNKIVEYSIHDNRLGKSHWAVPGPDGKKGFGGSCFPKDIKALIHLCKQINIDEKLLTAAWESNLGVRPEKDWEKLKGRAVRED